MSSSEFYDDNIRILKDRFGDVFLDTVKSEETESNGLRIESEELSDHKIPVVSKENITVLLDTMYDEEKYLNEWTEQQNIPDSIGLKIILFGLGNGIIARKLLSTYPDAVVLTVEPSVQVLKHVLCEYSLTDIFENQRFHILVTQNCDDDLSAFFSNHIKYADTANYCTALYPNYNLIFEEEFNLYKNTFKSFLNELRADYDFTGAYGDILNKNTFANIKYLSDSKSFIELMDGSLKGKTAIIVAAGPSLDKNISDLKAAEGKAFIVAVDAAMAPLCKAGIKPDVFVAVDPCKGGQYIKDEVSKHVPLITTLSSANGMISSHLGDKFFISDTRIYVSRFLRDNAVFMPLLPTGGSVANNAISLVSFLGCTTIILMGQDLGFAADHTHSKDSVRGNEKVSTDRELYTDVDIYGNEIKTLGEFLHFKKWIENFVADNPTIKVIDATEGGALIKGTQICTLKEAIANNCTEELDIASVLGKCKDLLNDDLKQDLYQYMKSLSDQYEHNRCKLTELVKEYNEMSRLVTDGEYRSKRFVELSKDTNSILNCMESDIGMEYVRDVIQDTNNRMMKSINMKKRSEEEDLLFICNQGEQYAKELIKAVDMVAKEIVEVFGQL